jgi:hypothetical protein
MMEVDYNLSNNNNDNNLTYHQPKTCKYGMCARRVLIQSNTSNNNCELVNIAWADRGILLTLMNSIRKHYPDIKKKKIVIQNDSYRDFAKAMFPELHFSHYKNDDPNNFYFNIRKIIKKQDVVIDYLKNYNHHIHTKKLHAVPWYDMNDPLIAYDYYPPHKVKPYKYLEFLKNFSKCRRGKYENGTIWDKYIENKIFKKYNELKPNTNGNVNYSIFIKFIMKNYIPDKKQIDYPKIYYINKNKKLIKNYQIKIKEMEKKIKNTPDKIIEVKNEENINFLLNILNNKLELVNKIIENN